MKSELFHKMKFRPFLILYYLDRFLFFRTQASSHFASNAIFASRMFCSNVHAAREQMYAWLFILLSKYPTALPG